LSATSDVEAAMEEEEEKEEAKEDGEKA